MSSFWSNFWGRGAEFGASEADLQSLQLPRHCSVSSVLQDAGRDITPQPLSKIDSACRGSTVCDHAEGIRSAAANFGQSAGLRVRESGLLGRSNRNRWRRSARVWISEDCSHRTDRVVWRQLEKPLSHFLVSFVLQEVMFGPISGSFQQKHLEKLQEAGLSVVSLWIDGEYANCWSQSSYYWIEEQVLLRRAPDEGWDDFYGCKDESGKERLIALGLAVQYG